MSSFTSCIYIYIYILTYQFCCRVLDPLVYGDYPQIMKKNAGSRIPAFTKAEAKLVKGSFDFIGVIHYSSIYVKDNPNGLVVQQRDYTADAAVTFIGIYILNLHLLYLQIITNLLTSFHQAMRIHNPLILFCFWLQDYRS